MLETGVARCRLCLAHDMKRGNFINIYSTDGMNLMLWHKINNLMNIAITACDAYTKAVCFLCVAKLDFVNQFKVVCIQSQYQLRKETFRDNPVIKFTDFECNRRNSKNDESQEFSNDPLDTADQSADEDEGCCDENATVTDSDGSECAENCFIARETVTINLQQLQSEAESHTSSDLYKIEKAEKSAEAIKRREATDSDAAEQHFEAESHAGIADSSAISKIIKEWKSAETVLIPLEPTKSDVTEQNCHVESHASNVNSAVCETDKSADNTSFARGTVKSDVQLKCSKRANHAGNTNCAFQEIATVVKAVSKSSISRESDLQEQVEASHVDCTRIQQLQKLLKLNTTVKIQEKATELKSKSDKSVVSIETIRTALQEQNIEAGRGADTAISIGGQETATGNTSVHINCSAKETKTSSLSNRIVEETSHSVHVESVVEVATVQRSAVKSTLVCVGEVTENHNCESLNSMEESDNCTGIAGQSGDRDIAAAKPTSVDITIVNCVQHLVDLAVKNLNCIVRNSDSVINSGATSVLVKNTVKSVQKRVISPTGATEIVELVELSGNPENKEAETTTRNTKKSENTQNFITTCEYCERTFSSEAKKQAHLDPPQKNGSQSCYLCDKPFLTLCAAYYHAAVEHGRNTLYRCDFCKMKFLECGDFEFHKFSVHIKKDLLKCDKCSWYGENSTHLEVHNRMKHTVVSDTRCPKCFKVLQDHNYLLKHAKVVHSDVLICKECHRGFNTPVAYFGHMCMHKQIKLYECPNCDKVLYTKDGLQRHFKTHLAVFPQETYKCVKCDYIFATKRSLVKHCNTAHLNEDHQSNDTYYDCDHCEKRCFSRSSIQKHLHRHLYKQKKMPCIECKICKKICCSKYSLKTHMMIHNKDKLYFCKICNKDFVGYSHKNMHYRVICEICGKSVNKQLFPEHESKHSNQRNELCTICGKSFFQKSTLKLHMFSHGEKKFVCKICGNGYNRNDNMKKHSLTCKGRVQLKEDTDSSSEDS